MSTPDSGGTASRPKPNESSALMHQVAASASKVKKSSTGAQNLIGAEAKKSFTNAQQNPIGAEAKKSSTSAQKNIIGAEAKKSSTGAQKNIIGAEAKKSSTGAQKNIIGAEAKKSSTDAQKNLIGANATVRAAAPVYTQRIINPGARDSAGRSLEIKFTEEFILTRPRDSVVPQERKTFDSDSVKALFTLGQSNKPSVVQPIANTNAAVQANGNSGLAAPVTGRPLSAFDFTPSPSTAGSVSHTGVIPGLGSNLAKVGNNVAHGYAPYSASKALSDAFNSYSAGVMIPGLGAPCKPLAHAVSSAQNSKTVVASPGNNPQSPMAEPLTRMADLVHPQPQARASINSLGAIVAQEVKPSAVAGTQPDALATDQSDTADHALPDALVTDQSDTADHVMPDASPDFKEQDAAKKYVRPSGEPEVWRQQQSSTSFKLQSMTRSSESFFGACVLLAGLNSEFYTMPYGSRVVAIKFTDIDDVFLSLQTGVWVTHPNVMSRVMDVHDSHENESMKTLLLFSMPGSKYFCGLAELQSYQPDLLTEFQGREGQIRGGMVIRWLYCKLVAFEETKHLEGGTAQQSITQMWNGMHYPEGVGREVVRVYVETPHEENLLAKPDLEFFKRVMANSKMLTGQPLTPNFNNQRGNNRYQPRDGRSGHSQRGHAENRTALPKGPLGNAAKLPKSSPNDAAAPSVERKKSPKIETAADVKQEANTVNTFNTVTTISPSNTVTVVRTASGADINADTASSGDPLSGIKPEIRYLAVLVHADGTLTTADRDGNVGGDPIFINPSQATRSTAPQVGRGVSGFQSSNMRGAPSMNHPTFQQMGINVSAARVVGNTGDRRGMPPPSGRSGAQHGIPHVDQVGFSRMAALGSPMAARESNYSLSSPRYAGNRVGFIYGDGFQQPSYRPQTPRRPIFDGAMNMAGQGSPTPPGGRGLGGGQDGYSYVRVPTGPRNPTVRAMSSRMHMSQQMETSRRLLYSQDNAMSQQHNGEWMGQPDYHSNNMYGRQ